MLPTVVLLAAAFTAPSQTVPRKLGVPPATHPQMSASRSGLYTAEQMNIAARRESLTNFQPATLPSSLAKTDALSFSALAGRSAWVATLTTAAVLGAARALPALSAAGAWYSNAAIATPYTTAVLTSTIKGAISDLFAQLVIERRTTPQYRRTFAFCLFGALWLGAFCQFKYAVLYSALFGTTKTVGAIAAKICCDLCAAALHAVGRRPAAFRGVASWNRQAVACRAPLPSN